MATSDRRSLTVVVLVVLAVLLLWPALMMLGFGGMGMMRYGGYGGMMGPYGASGYGWVGLGVQVVFPFLVLGGGYFLARRLLDQREARNPALEELRRAYARGELTDEEYETRRTKLRSED